MCLYYYTTCWALGGVNAEFSNVRSHLGRKVSLDIWNMYLFGHQDLPPFIAYRTFGTTLACRQFNYLHKFPCRIGRSD